ncbi:MAG: amidohydrolase family protein [Actinomycetota bacterium]|nr:amidohydrolase family protein [Actinomycetota bacterium]
MLIVDAEIAGRPGLCLRTAGARITEIAPGLRARADEHVIDARGGVIMPGLHDHHIHLYAAARAAHSIECGPPSVRDEAQLTSALRRGAERARPGESLRGIGYHESVAGELDADRLDAWVGDRPLRIQHRTGALWVLNHAALARIGAAPRDWPEGAERDAAGQPTGRFYRLDAWLRDELGAALERPALRTLSRRLARYGVTGVTDTTPTLEDDDAAFLACAIEGDDLLQRCVVMGSEALGPIDHPRLTRGPVKILLDEPALPDLDALVRRVRAAHDAGRGVAVHCVTRVELALAVTAIGEAGAIAGDRIEHASVAPPEWVDLVAATPIAVVTQPHFVHERGDAYLEDVEPDDRLWLYRTRAWLEAGVPLAGGSDAPYGYPDPWRAMAAAVARRTRAGRAVGAVEALTPQEALALFTSDPLEPGAVQRKIDVGSAADLVLLDAPWSTVRTSLDAKHVALTVSDGRVIHERD